MPPSMKRRQRSGDQSAQRRSPSDPDRSFCDRDNGDSDLADSARGSGSGTPQSVFTLYPRPRRLLPRFFGITNSSKKLPRRHGRYLQSETTQVGGRKVALKMILGGEIASVEAFVRFQRKRLSTALLEHPALCHLRVSEVDDNRSTACSSWKGDRCISTCKRMPHGGTSRGLISCCRLRGCAARARHGIIPPRHQAAQHPADGAEGQRAKANEGPRHFSSPVALPFVPKLADFGWRGHEKKGRPGRAPLGTPVTSAEQTNNPGGDHPRIGRLFARGVCTAPVTGRPPSSPPTLSRYATGAREGRFPFGV